MNYFVFTWCYFHKSRAKVINLSCGKLASGKLLLQGPGLGAELGLAPASTACSDLLISQPKRAPLAAGGNVVVNVTTM